MATGKRQNALKEFLKEADVCLKALEEKFLLLAKCLREKRDPRKDDLEAMSKVSRALNVAAVRAGLEKTAAITRYFGALLEYASEHSVAFDRKMADLLSGALEAVENLIKDLEQGGRESRDIDGLIKDIQKFTEKDPGSKGEGAAPAAVAIDETYLGVYLDETEQNIAHFNDDLVVLEKNPDDPGLINNLFRVIHTIKGSSAMMNISDVQKIAHAMENILVIARENRQASAEMFPLLFGGIDTVSNIIFSLRNKKDVSTDTVSLIEKLKMYAQLFPPAGSLLAAGMKRKDDLPELAVVSRSAREILSRVIARQDTVYRIMIALEENTPLKGMKASLVEEHLNGKGVVIVMHPRPEDIHDLRRGQVQIGILFGTAVDAREIPGLLSMGGVSVLSIAPIAAKEISELLAKRSVLVSSLEDHLLAGGGKPGLKESKKILPVTPAPGPSVLVPFIRIDARKLDTLMNLSGELVTIRAQYEGLVNQMRGEVSSGREFARVIVALKTSFSTLTREFGRWTGASDDPKIKHVFRELDALRGHLQRLEHAASESRLTTGVRRMDETTGALGKVASGIRAAVMQARMVPIHGVFSRFNRIVRDMAKEVGKDVTLVLKGEETELDRNLIDGIAEPLIHMVRNAIDHGIEDTHTRRNAGKPECGTITLRAFHQGSNICIEVEDDGRGLDAQLLAENALKKKLVTEDQVSRMTDREKWDLMFFPGFSTAARVTGLSGRGVGMDAMRSMVTALNGVVDIHSAVAQGTTFTLKIPMTLAIIQALLVVIGEEIYALPLEAVMEIMSVTQDMVEARNGQATVRLREHVVRLIDLKDVLHIRSASKAEQGMKRVAVITDGERRSGVFVDKFIKETEIVIKALPQQFSHVKGISGVTILGDGRVALILDPKVILQAA